MTTPLRTIQMVAAIFACGQPFFLAIIWRPTWRAATARPDQPEQRGKTLTIIAAVVLVATTAVAWLQLPATSASPLIWRIAGAVTLLMAQPWRPWGFGRAAIWAVASITIFTTFALTGHAAAALAASPVPLLAHIAHVTATSLWYGGLVGLAMLPWHSPAASAQARIAAAVTRFSRLGLATMAILGLSGVLLAWRNVYGLHALTEHPYGLTLLAKLGFVGGVLALAAFNHWNARPRLITGEVIGGIAVLLLAVQLAGTAPATIEPVRLHALIGDPVSLQTPPLQPVRLTVANDSAEPTGLYIPQIRGATGDLQVMVAAGRRRTVTFRAPSGGQYAIYYVDRSGLRPAGWLHVVR